MIMINNKTQCCGCASCSNVCPKQCIKMTEDNEGFLYPVVDKSLCLNCGLCEMVCPFISENAESDSSERKEIEKEYYVVQALDDKVRAESTSGGAFTPLAKVILAKGGTIFGAAFTDKSSFKVQHRYVENEDELGLFRSSKYVQSEISESMRDCKALLDKGRFVLFSGTPCQIAGLKTYLRKEYENLYTVDVVCRSVPSPKVFRKYLDWQNKRFPGGISDIRFRDKYYGYNYSTMSVYSKSNDRKDYHKGIESDLYLRTFFSGICDRPSCSVCPFRSRHLSDITIWDCFNVAAIAPEMDDNKGTSRMMINTKHGKQLLELSSDQFRMKSYTPDLSKREVAYSEKKENMREQFFADIDKLDSDTFFNKYFPNTAKVKLLGTARIMSYRLGFYKILKKICNVIKNRRA